MTETRPLDVITAAALKGVEHGFFTRCGGISTGIYAGLNTGAGSSDDPAHVAANRALVADHLQVEPANLLSVHQVHSDIVVHAQPGGWTPKPQADAMVTDRPGLALGALAADCAPVLFADARAGVIGAAHSGWKGALGGILGATVDAMVAMGAERDRITAVIGPCISQRAYEVGLEFMDRFLDDDPENDRYFAGGAGDKVQFDLPGFALGRLRDAGIGHAEWTGHCTYSDPQRFYSFRRTTHAGEPDYGRLISAIRI